jgi:hypothetical protein
VSRRSRKFAVLPGSGLGDRLACWIKISQKELLMFNDASRKQTNIARLIADLRAAKVELLSAQCAADRLRLQYTLQDIVAFGERQTLTRAIASADALHRFFSQVVTQLRLQEERNE